MILADHPTIRIPLILIGLFLVITCKGNFPGSEQLDYLFESGSEGYEYFRIPAIITTTKGTILAFAEGRKNGRSDTGDIDLVMKRSEDNGISWSELVVIWDDGENVCGNPAPVVDKMTGTIHLLSTWNLGEDHEREIIEGTSSDTRRVFVLNSADDGLTWSVPEEITQTVKLENWTWYATGPCHGIQLSRGAHKGRLLIPCDHIEAESKKYYSHTIYSDDHGKSWVLGGTTPQDQVNESTVAELPDGRVILNMRNYDRSQKSRKVAFSKDGGESWSDISADHTLIEPICQASLLMVGKEEDEKQTLLFSNPADENNRQNMTLRISWDEGSSWARSMVLHDGPAAYSDMTRLSNGNLGCFYEAGHSSPYEGIVFQEINWQQIKRQSKFLLLDERIIERIVNAKLKVGSVTKDPANPVMKEDKSWEKRFDNLYGNVLYDEDEEVFKLWYSPFIIDSSSAGMTLLQRQRKYRAPPNREMAICYATSKDGINWVKPNLGLVEYEGSKQNNILWRGPHGAGLFVDAHDTDPHRRYKMIFQGLAVSFSDDGIHWSESIPCSGVEVAGDTHNNALWAPTLNRYVGFTRTRGDFGREVSIIKSDNFIDWTKEEVVLKGVDRVYQTYAMPVFYYGGVYLGLVAIHNQKSDRVWTELTWSPDMEKWYRISPGIPLIPNSEQVLDYDYGCVYACAYPIFTEEEVIFYYGGSDWLHTSWRNGFLCRASMRPDGFAGYVQEVEERISQVTTKAVPYNGRNISITADVEKGGFLKVYVLDPDNNLLAESKNISETITDKTLELSENISGYHLKLKFEFSNATIYSFSFRE